MAKPKPPVEAVVDTAVHPLFARLREEAGFAEFSGATLETMLEAPGLKMVLFAEDPNLRRETLDIAVIGPELRKALGAAVVFGMAMNAFIGTLFVPNFWAFMQTLSERLRRKAPPTPPNSPATPTTGA